MVPRDAGGGYAGRVRRAAPSVVQRDLLDLLAENARLEHPPELPASRGRRRAQVRRAQLPLEDGVGGEYRALVRVPQRPARGLVPDDADDDGPREREPERGEDREPEHEPRGPIVRA